MSICVPPNNDGCVILCNVFRSWSKDVLVFMEILSIVASDTVY